MGVVEVVAVLAVLVVVATLVVAARSRGDAWVPPDDAGPSPSGTPSGSRDVP